MLRLGYTIGTAVPMKSIAVFVAAAVAEIAGCYGFWLWIKQDKAELILPAVLSLGLFAWLLTNVDSAFAGRAYAAYGGIYVVGSLLWLWRVEGMRTDRWDLAGAALCIAGAAVIIFAPREAGSH